MKKLSKIQVKEKDELSAEVQRKFENLNNEIEAYNEKCDELWSDVDEALTELNTVIEEAKEWRDDIVNTIQEYVDERSDKWPESETGERVIGWKDNIEALELEPIELEKPEACSPPDFNESVLDDMDTEA